MKQLIIMTLFLLVGCSVKNTPRLDPKFEFGQTVTIVSGFYKDNSGIIDSWTYCVYESKEGNISQGVCYDLHGFDGLILVTLKGVHEEDISVIKNGKTK